MELDVHTEKQRARDSITFVVTLLYKQFEQIERYKSMAECFAREAPLRKKLGFDLMFKINVEKEQYGGKKI